MAMKDFNRRRLALLVLAGGCVAAAAIYFWPRIETMPSIATTTTSIAITTTTSTNTSLTTSNVTSSYLRALQKTNASLQKTNGSPPKCSTQLTSGTINFYLSKSQIESIYDATRLNKLASNFISGPIDWNIEKGRQEYALFDGWTNFRDTALVAKSKTNGVCHLVLGTGITPWDLWQNLNPFTSRMPGTECDVRKGYYDAYFNVPYYGELRTSVSTCLSSCNAQGKQCPLVISGYSQAGAIAVISAIDLRQFNPTTITFGATQALVPYNGECKQFNANTHFRIVSVTGRFYDGITVQINPFFAKHYGHFLILEDDDTMFGYPGFNVDTMNRFPMNHFAHLPYFYSHRIQRMLERGCFPIPVGKWGRGHWCNYPDECSSNSCEDHECQ